MPPTQASVIQSVIHRPPRHLAHQASALAGGVNTRVAVPARGNVTTMKIALNLHLPLPLRRHPHLLLLVSEVEVRVLAIARFAVVIWPVLVVSVRCRRSLVGLSAVPVLTGRLVVVGGHVRVGFVGLLEDRCAWRNVRGSFAVMMVVEEVVVVVPRGQVAKIISVFRLGKRHLLHPRLHRLSRRRLRPIQPLSKMCRRHK